MSKQPKITPFLWFASGAEDALRFYASIFERAKLLELTRWGPNAPAPEGTLMTATLELAGQRLMLMQAGGTPGFNDSISLMVACDSQAEVDRYWNQLLAGGGQPVQCGWLRDKFGVSWQVTPTALMRMMADKDPAKVQRVTAAMMQMVKLDLAELERAFAGPAAPRKSKAKPKPKPGRKTAAKPVRAQRTRRA